MDDNTSYSSIERRRLVQQYIEKNKRARIQEVSDTFAVSLATARRDLEALAEEGKVERVHGGAIAICQAPPEPPLLRRADEQAVEKRRIGEAAARLVRDGETIFLGSGTTVLELAQNLRTRRGLTVITNSIPVISVLAELPDFTILDVGGVLRPKELSLIGHITEENLAKVHADKVLIGIRAIDEVNGLFSDHLPEILTDRAILRIGGEVIVLADHTKCDRISTAQVAGLDSIHTLVTDSETPPDFIEALRKQNIRVLIA